MKIDPNKPILHISPKCISFPVGLSHIAASIRQAGFRVECINLSQTPGHVIKKDRHDIVATGGLACHFNPIMS